ncbi:MAG: hypothetical protein QOD97_1919, partial [Mycobacterium sp.]|nr:hypothetical protein [Mycobacterium sp.]
MGVNGVILTYDVASYIGRRAVGCQNASMTQGYGAGDYPRDMIGYGP